MRTHEIQGFVEYVRNTSRQKSDELSWGWKFSWEWESSWASEYEHTRPKKRICDWKICRSGILLIIFVILCVFEIFSKIMIMESLLLAIEKNLSWKFTKIGAGLEKPSGTQRTTFENEWEKGHPINFLDTAKMQ